MTPLHFSQVRVTVSMKGRCRSVPSARPSSEAELTIRCSPHCSQIQIGTGVPQYLVRENCQSMLFSIPSPIRPVLMCAGTQLVALLLAIRSAFLSVVLMYQAS